MSTVTADYVSRVFPMMFLDGRGGIQHNYCYPITESKFPSDLRNTYLFVVDPVPSIYQFIRFHVLSRAFTCTPFRNIDIYET